VAAYRVIQDIEAEYKLLGPLTLEQSWYNTNMIQLEEKYLNMLREAIARNVDTAIWQPVIFGSRASGRAQRFSDIDLGFSGLQPLPISVQAKLQDALDESDIPYVIDIVDLSVASPEFREVATQHMEQLA